MAVANGLLTISAPPAPISVEDSRMSLRNTAALLSGSSPAVLQLLGQIRRVAPYFRTALLTGERGCGEESAAHALHQASQLAARPFLTLTAIEADLRLSAGYEPVATLGMIYLPQPERISANSQRVLLRLLRERGANAPRLVAFAERGLRSLVSMGAFSAELADSLDALRIALPPLRERAADIPELLLHLVHHHAERLALPPPVIAPSLSELAAKQAWPGNFDQLHAVAIGLLERGAGVTLYEADLQAVLCAAPEPPPRDRREVRMVSLDRVLHEHIRAVLFACNGNKLRAAEILGISRSTLYRMLDSKLPTEASLQGTALSTLSPEPQHLRMAG